MEDRIITIEFYNENCAYIGTDNGSGYELKARSKEQLADKIKEYLINNILN